VRSYIGGESGKEKKKYRKTKNEKQNLFPFSSSSPFLFFPWEVVPLSIHSLLSTIAHTPRARARKPLDAAGGSHSHRHLTMDHRTIDL